MIQANDDEAERPAIDPDAAVEHVRNAWLRLQVFDHVDVGRGGGFAFDPSNYTAVPVQRDGQHTVVFART